MQWSVAHTEIIELMCVKSIKIYLKFYFSRVLLELEQMLKYQIIF